MLLRAGSEWLKENRAEVRVVRAEVLVGNEASARAFLASGFEARDMIFIQRLSI